jgi:error-prone DNA polymerase
MELRGRTRTDLELRDLNVAMSNHQVARFHDLFRERMCSYS